MFDIMGSLKISIIFAIAFPKFFLHCALDSFPNPQKFNFNTFCDSSGTYSHRCIAHEPSILGVQIVSRIKITSNK